MQYVYNKAQIVFKLAKNRDNTEKYHANVLKNKLNMEKFREGNCVIQSSTAPPQCHNCKKIFVIFIF